MVKFIVEVEYWVYELDSGDHEIELNTHHLIPLSNKVGHVVAAEEEFSNLGHEWIDDLNTMPPSDHLYRMVFEVELSYRIDYWGDCDADVELTRRWEGKEEIQDTNPLQDKSEIFVIG